MPSARNRIKKLLFLVAIVSLSGLVWFAPLVSLMWHASPDTPILREKRDYDDSVFVELRKDSHVVVLAHAGYMRSFADEYLIENSALTRLIDKAKDVFFA